MFSWGKMARREEQKVDSQPSKCYTIVDGFWDT